MRRERLPAPPPPARLRPLQPGSAPPRQPACPGRRRRHPVGGFPCPGSGARRRPGPGEGEEKGEGRGVEGRQGRRLRGGSLWGRRTSGWVGLWGERAGRGGPDKDSGCSPPLETGIRGNSWGWKFRKRSLCRAGRRSESWPVFF